MFFLFNVPIYFTHTVILLIKGRLIKLVFGHLKSPLVASKSGLMFEQAHILLMVSNLVV